MSKLITDENTINSLIPILKENFPEIHGVRIYGTCHDPLFIAKDMQELLGLKDLHLRRDFELGVEKVEIEIDTAKGLRSAIALTECGLYSLLAKLDGDIGKKFRHYIYIVLHELRIKGNVELQKSLDLFKEDMDKQLKLKEEELKLKDERYKKMEEISLRESKDKNEAIKKLKVTESQLQTVQIEAKVYKSEFNNMSSRLLNLQRMSGESDNISKLEKLQVMFLKKIYLKICKVPEDSKFQEENGWLPIPQRDEEEPWADDDELVFSIGFAEPDIDHKLGELFVKKEINLDKIHKHLAKYKFYIKDSKGTILSNKYFGLIQDFSAALDELL